jgi:hypothetical protein
MIKLCPGLNYVGGIENEGANFSLSPPLIQKWNSYQETRSIK